MINRKFCLAVSFALMFCLASNAIAQDTYYWTNASGDGMWNRDTQPYNWARGDDRIPSPPPEHGSSDVFISGNPSTLTTPLVIPEGYTADCAYGAEFGTIFGPEWGLHLDIYGSLTYRWYLVLAQAQEGLIDPANPDNDPNRSVVNMYRGSKIHGTEDSPGDSVRAEGIAIGTNWWAPLPYVTMNMYEGSECFVNWAWLGGHLNLYGGTFDVLSGFNMGIGTPENVPDILIRLDIHEGNLILPPDSSDAVQDWIDRGILKAYGMTPGELKSKDAQILIDTTTVPDRTIVTALPQSPPQASMPEPVNGATDVSLDPNLSWRIGYNAARHDVYFGTNANDINDVNSANLADYPNVTYENLSANSFSPGTLDMNTTYYWRVDEVNDAHPDMLWKGDVWSFTTLNFFVVEDFEDYNDYEPHTVWDTWIDGYGDPANGSTAGYPNPDFVAGQHYLEDVIVHSGNWSMPFFYDNSVGLSEVTRTLNADWTVDDVVTLTLFYYGDPNNTPQPMYVVIDDAIFTNDDINAALVTEWTRWDISLQLLADQGVNLSNVGSMTIGFGNKANPTPDGSGHVFIDDIRLYRP
jgi:hypothetical protein